MRPIKFRGKHFLNYVYGYYVESNWDDGTRKCFIFDDDGNSWQIYAGSAEQLVGYDADGNEVYEGDGVIDIEDGEMPWGGNPRLAVVDEDCNFLGDIGDSFEDVKLKES